VPLSDCAAHCVWSLQRELSEHKERCCDVARVQSVQQVFRERPRAVVKRERYAAVQ